MKTKIVIANTLKPVDDVRAFEKIAQSITKTNKYQVNIIGIGSKKESGNEDIKFEPHSCPNKTILNRLVMRVKIGIKLFRINPQIIIVQTHELLYLSILHKILRKSRILYDVREDYKKNIRFLSPLPSLMRLLLSQLIRWKERLASPFMDQFWLAEKCYLYEIGFPKSRCQVIENKAASVQCSRPSRSTSTLKCLFSGTISKYGEVMLAIEVFKELQKQLTESSLTIIGQCHDSRLKSDLEQIERAHKKIELIISENPIDHNDIIEQILRSNLGIISYQPNQVNQNKIPTKLYEYSRNQLPFLIQKGTTWEQKAKKIGGAISIDFGQPKVSFIAQQLENSVDLFPVKYPESETWESQEPIIETSLSSLI